MPQNYKENSAPGPFPANAFQRSFQEIGIKTGLGEIGVHSGKGNVGTGKHSSELIDIEVFRFRAIFWKTALKQ
ncbi:hypothetical protein [Sabulibacter ruber]|uniref:hypothetical protein n=1 Tax=Sabulibacter ruber TaxID=2811901 RepID=UPI001A95969E|nr:hypothetical protein [Sabulibacter ruber]